MGFLDLFRIKSNKSKQSDEKTNHTVIEQKKQINPINPDWSPVFEQIVVRANLMETDLVEMSEHHPTCGECAKYQGRVYSLSGKSKKFPKIPQIIIEKGYICKGCRHAFYPYIDGLSLPNYHEDIVAYSNSPFVDNRTPEEIAEYDARQKEIHDKKRDEKEYTKICEKLPEIAPKSFGGYRRMKNAKSANYLKLVEECKKVKIKIED